MTDEENQNITYIDLEANLPHIVSEVICIRCKKRWFSARPEEVLLKNLECPKCKKKGYVIETGQVIEE